ncbi:MAG: hypothetical protein H6636_07630 [Anaerolineales bacterium]|nr:hypothetical protein [Anaerolineales bacterium]
MEDEIDLQKYILLLIKNWAWIVGVSLVFAVGAYLLSKFVLAPTYEAKALVLIVPSRYSLTFDPKFQTESSSELLYFRPTAQLAESDTTMQALRDAWIDQGGDPETTIEKIEGITEVELDTASNSMKLIVRTDNAQMSTDLVNLWGTILVQKANALFGEDLESGDTLQAQFVQIEADRETAKQALVAYEAQNQTNILTTELTVKQTVYSQLLTDQAKLTQILADLSSLQAQLRGLPSSQPIASDIELTALLLQLKAYNLDLTLPQLQWNPSTSDTLRTVGVLNTSLDQLRTVMEQKALDLAQQIDPLQAEILQIQSQVADMQATGEKLRQNYQVASDTYLTLDRKMKETQISNEVSGSVVKLGSRAKVPTEPVGPRTLLNTLIAGVLGLMLSVFGIFARDFWVNVPEDQQPFHHAQPKKA